MYSKADDDESIIDFYGE